MSYTKGKWEIDLYGQSQNTKAVHVGPLGYVDGIASVLRYDGKKDEQEANAARICQCVNNFDDLLEACKKGLELARLLNHPYELSISDAIERAVK